MKPQCTCKTCRADGGSIHFAHCLEGLGRPWEKTAFTILAFGLVVNFAKKKVAMLNQVEI